MATPIFTAGLISEIVNAVSRQWNTPERFLWRGIFDSDFACARCARGTHPSHDEAAFGLAVRHPDGLALLELSLNVAQFCAATADIDGDDVF